VSDPERTRKPSELLPRERRAAEEVRVARERGGDAFGITPRELRQAFLPRRRRYRRTSAAEWRLIEHALASERLRPRRPLKDSGLDERVGLELTERPALERLRRSRYWRLTTKTSKRVYWAIGVALTLIGAYQLIVPDKRPGPEPMTGRVNIAVAPFEVSKGLGEDGRHAGFAIAQSVYENIRRQIRESAPQLGLQVRPPDQVGLLSAPRTDVSRLARTIRADVVVYARIAQRNSVTALIPSLYVSPRMLPGAAELAGSHSFGGPITARGPATNPVVGGDLALRVTARAAALSHVCLPLRRAHPVRAEAVQTAPARVRKSDGRPAPGTHASPPRLLRSRARRLRAWAAVSRTHGRVRNMGRLAPQRRARAWTEGQPRLAVEQPGPADGSAAKR